MVYRVARTGVAVAALLSVACGRPSILEGLDGTGGTADGGDDPTASPTSGAMTSPNPTTADGSGDAPQPDTGTPDPITDTATFTSDSGPVSDTGDAETGSVSVSDSGPVTTSPPDTGPETTGPETTGPETTGPATTGPATTGPATTGPMTTGPMTSSTSDTGSSSDTGATGSTGGVIYQPYEGCNPDVVDCGPGFVCLNNPLGTQTTCATDCNNVAMCPDPPPGGEVACGDITGDGDDECYLTCDVDSDCPSESNGCFFGFVCTYDPLP